MTPIETPAAKPVFTGSDTWITSVTVTFSTSIRILSAVIWVVYGVSSVVLLSVLLVSIGAKMGLVTMLFFAVWDTGFLVVFTDTVELSWLSMSTETVSAVSPIIGGGINITSPSGAVVGLGDKLGYGIKGVLDVGLEVAGLVDWPDALGLYPGVYKGGGSIVGVVGSGAP